MYTNYIIAGILVLNFFLPIGYMMFKKQKQQKTTKLVLGSQIFVFFATLVQSHWQLLKLQLRQLRQQEKAYVFLQQHYLQVCQPLVLVLP